MLYDIITIFNISICLLSAYNFLAIISRSRKKNYEPPEIRRRHTIGLYSLLAVPSISLGALVRVVYLDLYQDSLFATFATIACIAMLLSSIQFLMLSKEKEISIKDIPTLRGDI